MSGYQRMEDVDTTSASKSNMDPKKMKRQKQARILVNLNIAAFVLHACSFIAALGVSIAFASQSFQTELTTDFRRYDANATSPSSAGKFSSTIVSHGYYQLVWIDLPFPFITALFHALIAFVPAIRSAYLRDVLSNRGNYLRWLEYSITASLMTWVILQLSGVTNVLMLVMVGVVCNVALQSQGYLQEKLRRVSWIPTLVGWLIFAMQWSIIFSYFFTAITSARPIGVEQAPWFVYVIVIGLFFFFALFGLVQLTHIAEWPRFMASGYAQDIAYLILSLTSKLFLTWNLLIGIATNGPASSS